jgi:hypothetical protein
MRGGENHPGRDEGAGAPYAADHVLLLLLGQCKAFL